VSQAWSSAPSDRLDPAPIGAPDPALLSKLVYRSRAVQPLSSADLYKLTLAAQARNRAESITGLMLYDRDSFYQWLEGPTDGLERVMRSIRDDPRHTDIVVLEQQSGQARLFADWSMKLAAAGQASASWRSDVMEPPLQAIDSLRRHPEAAPGVLATLVPALPAHSSGNVTEFRAAVSLPLHRHAATILKAVILDTVIPELAARHGLPQGGPGPLPASKRMLELAELLIAADQTAARELIAELQGTDPGTVSLYATLFEPAARRLGDLWSEDVCSEFEVTLGLARIQTAVRLLSSDLVRRTARRLPGPSVLIAPEPGELHRLGAVLDSEVLWNIGWNPHCAYPADDHALEDIMAATWFDVLDLSLSTAFRREHWLPRLTKTIDAARHASRNPTLVVVVGGRVFAEHAAIGAQVGADAASTTALHVDQSIMDGMRREA
jgi:methanogenic corrinoid protein MtbC1